MTTLTEGYLLRPGVVLAPGLFIFGAELRAAQLHALRPLPEASFSFLPSRIQNRICE